MTNDIVFWDGCSWAASKVVTINCPPPNDGWLLCAAKGRDGSSGRDGRDGSEGKIGPGVPAGGTNNQVLLKQSESDYDTRWGCITATQIGAANEQHRHSMDDVIGLGFAMSALASKRHLHSISDIAGLKESLETKCTARHKHDVEDIASGDMTMRSIALSNSEPTITLRNNESGEVSSIKQTMWGTLNIVSSGGLSITIGDSSIVHAGRNGVSIDGSMVANSIKAGFDGLIISGPITPKTGNGEKGQLCWDSECLYLCIGKGIWKKIRLENM